MRSAGARPAATATLFQTPRAQASSLDTGLRNLRTTPAMETPDGDAFPDTPCTSIAHCTPACALHLPWKHSQYTPDPPPPPRLCPRSAASVAALPRCWARSDCAHARRRVRPTRARGPSHRGISRSGTAPLILSPSSLLLHSGTFPPATAPREGTRSASAFAPPRAQSPAGFGASGRRAASSCLACSARDAPTFRCAGGLRYGGNGAQSVTSLETHQAPYDPYPPLFPRLRRGRRPAKAPTRTPSPPVLTRPSMPASRQAPKNSRRCRQGACARGVWLSGGLA